MNEECFADSLYLISRLYVTGFEKSHAPSTHNYKSLEISIFEVLYLEKENRCLHEIRHDSIAIYTLPMHQLLNE